MLKQCPPLVVSSFLSKQPRMKVVSLPILSADPKLASRTKYLQSLGHVDFECVSSRRPSAQGSPVDHP